MKPLFALLVSCLFAIGCAAAQKLETPVPATVINIEAVPPPPAVVSEEPTRKEPIIELNYVLPRREEWRHPRCEDGSALTSANRWYNRKTEAIVEIRAVRVESKQPAEVLQDLRNQATPEGAEGAQVSEVDSDPSGGRASVVMTFWTDGWLFKEKAIVMQPPGVHDFVIAVMGVWPEYSGETASSDLEAIVASLKVKIIR